MRKQLLAILLATGLALALATAMGRPAAAPAGQNAAGSEEQAAEGSEQTHAQAAEQAAEGSEQTHAQAAEQTGAEGSEQTAAASGQQEPVEYSSPRLTGFEVALHDVHTVDGRQGIAWENGRYYVSGSTSLSCYDADWNLTAVNTDPFTGEETTANHIGDIDVYKGEIYAGAEYFADGEAADIQIAVFDAETLKFTRTIPFDASSGQTECSGVAVDPDTGSLWLCSWAADDSGHYLYRYDLTTGAYAGRFLMKQAPQWIQGAAYYDGWLYLTADDGSADEKAPDHVYRCQVDLSAEEWDVAEVYALEDVTMQGEIEGLSFDRAQRRLLVSYNHGARIVQGMAKGFYDGFTEEIHEVYTYDLTRTFRPLDYSDPTLWIRRPAEPDREADIFFLLPTVNLKGFVPDNEDVYNLTNVLRFDLTMNLEEGLVTEAGNVYAPLYRQMTIGSYLEPDGRLPATISPDHPGSDSMEYAYRDIRDAFLYYREHLGGGRPFVLFGYSQGAQMALRLLEEFGDDEDFREDFVAAYVIGASVTDDFLSRCPYLQTAQAETDTGVIVSFNVMDEKAQLPDTHEHAINPLNWRTDATPADNSQNLGYVTIDIHGSVVSETPAYCGARLDEKTGKLLVTGIENQDALLDADPGLFRRGDYHLSDLYFFYRNLQKNVNDRIEAFEEK